MASKWSKRGMVAGVAVAACVVLPGTAMAGTSVVQTNGGFGAIPAPVYVAQPIPHGYTGWASVISPVPASKVPSFAWSPKSGWVAWTRPLGQVVWVAPFSGEWSWTWTADWGWGAMQRCNLTRR